VFSNRTPPDLTPNRLTRALSAVRAAGTPLIDLTESNPTRAGFRYAAGLLAPLGDPRGLTYAPSPSGLLDARRAVAADYARRGVDVAPARIVLTAGTSDAYAWLFKLLADAGDDVLVPRPSYPLFDHLARLDAVNARSYDLEYHGRWSIDLTSVDRAITSRTRAVLVVSPNNPTGSFITPDELDRLAGLCRRRDLALIADEVFADYELVPGAATRAGRVLDRRDALVFSLGGLSKTAGLPQIKLGWIAAAGPEPLVDAALERLEHVGDTYLPVSTPVQLSAAALLTGGATLREQIAARVVANDRRLRALAAGAPACHVTDSQGGWYGVLQVPSLVSEEELVLTLLQADGVLVHPGYFFDFSRESYLIVSLLVDEQAFADGIGRVLGRLRCLADR
jgi:hypothetical protein